MLPSLTLLLVEEGWPSGQARKRLIFAAPDEADVAEFAAPWQASFGDLLRPGAFRLLPLRERSEDLPSLIQLLTRRLAQWLGRGAVVIPPAALKQLTAYDWPENYDELEAVLTSVIQHTPPVPLDEELLPTRIRCARLRRLPDEGISLAEEIKRFEAEVIAQALRQAGGIQKQAAQLLRLRPQTLNMKLKQLGSLPA